ncbi:MAG: response regulator [Bryobacteraceae bacterium]
MRKFAKYAWILAMSLTAPSISATMLSQYPSGVDLTSWPTEWSALPSLNDGAEEARSICEHHPGVIDLLVTDVVIAQTGGKELVRQIRAFRPSVKVLFVSGHSSSDLVRDGLMEPDACFLPKPFMALTLEERIREMPGPGQRCSHRDQVADAIGFPDPAA